jgi:hypothetical protein
MASRPRCIRARDQDRPVALVEGVNGKLCGSPRGHNCAVVLDPTMNRSRVSHRLLEYAYRLAWVE